jgi:hypothetical protein
MRRGFGLVQVMFFMVIISTILAISMRYASITVKQTEDLYIKEQIELFMQSSIELAMLGIEGSATNLKKITIISDDKRFISTIEIKKYYLKSSSNASEESNGMIDMNIIVETNSTHPKNSTQVRLVKRTLQRP